MLRSSQNNSGYSSIGYTLLEEALAINDQNVIGSCFEVPINPLVRQITNPPKNRFRRIREGQICACRRKTNWMRRFFAAGEKKRGAFFRRDANFFLGLFFRSGNKKQRKPPKKQLKIPFISQFFCLRRYSSRCLSSKAAQIERRISQ